MTDHTHVKQQGMGYTWYDCDGTVCPTAKEITTMATTTITVTTRDTYHTIGEMEEDNRRIGHSWFDTSNKRAFGSRTLDTVYGGHYFVSSEQHKAYYPRYICEPRMYTVRSCFDGYIDTVGEFQQYKTAEQAKRAAREAARAIGAVRGHESTEVE